VRAIELNKVYRSSARPVRAVANVSICVKRGEFVAIRGRSGSGSLASSIFSDCSHSLIRGATN
jgi:ABC-type lipoprotein export system ATPase subunit